MIVTPLLTADGSYTLYHRELDETYHSRHGAVQESLHVFIRNGLDFVIARGAQKINILEIGFGTGLNAWLTFQTAIAKHVSIRYTSIEPYALPESLWSKLNYVSADQQQDFARLHRSQWNEQVPIHDLFELTKLNTTIQEANLPASHFHLVYFDAFAPAKQPELWTYNLLARTCRSLCSAGVWVTYSAKGEVRRNLQQCGMVVEKLAGPPGKRHMLRAIKP